MATQSNRKILYIQYANPAYYPPLQHSAAMLAADGWKVQFLGIRMTQDDNISLNFHPNISTHINPFCPPGWRQKIHYFLFCAQAIIFVFRMRPAWIYVSDSLACFPALLISFFSRAKLLYHEHDFPGYPNTQSLFARVLLWARYRLSKRVEFCIIPNKDRARHFHSTINPNATILVVWNCPSRNEVISSCKNHKRDGLWVYFHGTIGPTRVPLALVKALTLIPEHIRLMIVGYEPLGHEGYVQQLKKTAIEYGISHRIEFLKVINRQDSFNTCNPCHIGLAFVPRKSKDINFTHMIGASNKVFDYLACGLPVLVADLPDWKKAYVDGGFGLACDPEDAESIASALRWFDSHPDESRVMGERGKKKILSEWNYEKKFAPVLEILTA